jgi:hypothetical protein
VSGLQPSWNSRRLCHHDYLPITNRFRLLPQTLKNRELHLIRRGGSAIPIIQIRKPTITRERFSSFFWIITLKILQISTPKRKAKTLYVNMLNCLFFVLILLGLVKNTGYNLGCENTKNVNRPDCFVGA